MVDDGLYFLDALSRLPAGTLPFPCAIVEQTTRGIIKLQASEDLLKFSESLPLINVAESQVEHVPWPRLHACIALSRQQRT